VTRSLLALLVLAGCTSNADTDVAVSDPAVPVETQALAEAPVARPMRGVGRVQAATELTLAFPFPGIVERVNVRGGEKVKARQVLATLDARAAHAQLAAAKSALAKAQRDQARANALEGTGTAPREIEDAKTGVEVASANVEAAEFQSGRSALLAPEDGTVLDVPVDAGQTVGAGMPILHFAASDGWEVPVVLSAAEGMAVAVGTPAQVSVQGIAAPLRGTLVEKAGGAGPLGGWEVTVAIDPAGIPLAAGLVANVTLQPQPQPTKVVPLEALAEADGDEAFIYVVADGAADRVPVRIAWFDGDTVALSEGPPLGSEVIVKGVPFVHDGVSVRGAK
jgi:membrane fusion protein, multidrug efflux system